MKNLATPYIHFAYRFDYKGGGEPLREESIGREIKADKLAWVHMDARRPETRAWLEQEVSYLDNLVLDALLAEDTRPRMIELNDGLLLILRGMNFNVDADPEDMVSMRIWMDPHRIISLERRSIRVFKDLSIDLEKGKGPRSAAEFLVQVCSRLFEHMDPVLSELEDAIDDIEEQVIEDPSFDERQIILEIRKQAIMFKRYMSPQRDVMAHLCNSNLKWLDILHKRYLQESYNCVLRYVENLDTIRERAQIVKDELSNVLSERINKNMYVLSVVAAIFLPLGFLTGLLGINVTGIPGAQNPYAFWIFVLCLLVLFVFQIWLFKKFKWL